MPKAAVPSPLDFMERLARATKDKRIAIATLPPQQGVDNVFADPTILRQVLVGLGFLDTTTRYTAFDPAIGTGTFWAGVNAWLRVAGIEQDPALAQGARLVLAHSEILEGNFANYLPKDVYDFAGGIAPSGTLLDQHGQFGGGEGAEMTKAADTLYYMQCARALRPGGLLFTLMPDAWYDDAEEPFQTATRRLRLIASLEMPGWAMIGPRRDQRRWRLMVFCKARLVHCGAMITKSTYRVEHLHETLRCTSTKQRTLLAAMRQEFLTRYVNRPDLIVPEELKLKDVAFASERMLPVTDTVEARIIPNGNRLTLIPNGAQAQARIRHLNKTSGRIYDARRERYSTRFAEMLREPFEYAGNDLVAALRSVGVTPVLTDDQVRRLARRARWAERQLTPFEQVVWREKEERWEELYRDNGLRTRYAAEHASWVVKLHAIGVADHLFPYQVDDVARMCLKDRILLGSDVGIGKSVEFLCYVLARGFKRSLIVCNSKLLGNWADEIEKWQKRLPHLDLSYTTVRKLSDIGTVKDGRLLDASKVMGARFTLVSFESLWRVPADSIHTGRSQYTDREKVVIRQATGDSEVVKKRAFHVANYSLAAHLRPLFRNGAIMADEVYRIQNTSANQTVALNLLRSRVRVGACATLIKNYVDDILSIFNWVYGERSLLLRRFGAWTQGEHEAFVRRYGTFVYFLTDNQDTPTRKRMIPQIARQDEFRQLIAPMMLRRARSEPDVAPFVGTAEPSFVHESIPMDAEHRAFYTRMIREFREWYKVYLADLRQRGIEANPSEILARLRVLGQASTCPQYEALSLGGRAPVRYTGSLTAKQRRTLDLARMHNARGEKVVVFCTYKQGVHVLAEAMKDLNPVVVTGDISLTIRKRTGRSRRHDLINQFRFGDHGVLITLQSCMSEGYNIPEASVAILHDSDWTPSVDYQAIGRLRRPDQQRQITAYRLSHSGTVDEYVTLLSGAKAQSHASALDDAEYLLAVGMIPDVHDYANGLLDGLSLDEMRPMRKIDRIEVSDLIVYSSRLEGRIKETTDIGKILADATSRMDCLFV